jgi:hypothetical protein
MSDLDRFDDSVRELRTAIFPVVAIPSRGGAIAGYALVASAAVTVAGGIVQAVSYHFPQPVQSSGLFTGQLNRPQLTAVDRVQLLTRGAGVFSALLVLLGAVLLVVASRSEDRRDSVRAGGLWVAAAVAAVVLVANTALGVAFVADARGALVAGAVADRVASILALLAPVAISAGVLLFVVVHLASVAAPAHGTAGSGDAPGATPR